MRAGPYGVQIWWWCRCSPALPDVSGPPRARSSWRRTRSAGSCLVLNRVSPGTKLRDATDRELRARNLTVLPATLGNRTAFSHAFAVSLGVTEAVPAQRTLRPRCGRLRWRRGKSSPSAAGVGDRSARLPACEPAQRGRPRRPALPQSRTRSSVCVATVAERQDGSATRGIAGRRQLPKRQGWPIPATRRSSQPSSARLRGALRSLPALLRVPWLMPCLPSTIPIGRTRPARRCPRTPIRRAPRPRSASPAPRRR